MEESKGKDNKDPKDLWSSNAEPEASEEQSKANSEQERLTAAMLDWKKKGNDRLAEACADALELNSQEKELPAPQDDEFTSKLKKQVEMLEAEASKEDSKEDESESKEDKTDSKG